MNKALDDLWLYGYYKSDFVPAIWNSMMRQTARSGCKRLVQSLNSIITCQFQQKKNSLKISWPLSYKTRQFLLFVTVVFDVDGGTESSLQPASPFWGRLLRGWYLYSGCSRLCLILNLSASLWNGVFSSSFNILE